MKTLYTLCAAALLATATLAAADDPIQTASDALRAAVDGKKGAAEIKKLALAVFAETKKAMGPAPADTDKAYWADHQKYAESSAEYAGYALYAASAGAPAATAIDMISTLEAQDPKSKYLNQDAYLLVANAAMSAQQADRASAFAKKAITAPKGAKPDAATANAHYIVGVVAATKNDYATADKELRAALPGIKSTPLEGTGLFYLGEADYALGRKSMDRTMADQGIKYILQCALISGQYQSQASAEAKRMKAEMGEK